MQRTKLSNDSAAKRVCECFQEVRKALAEAREHIENGKAVSSHRDLENVRRLLSHLHSTVNLVAGGDLALQMQQLYDFVMDQTMVISTSKDLKQLEALELIIDNMNRAWQQLTVEPTSAPNDNPIRSVTS